MFEENQLRELFIKAFEQYFSNLDIETRKKIPNFIGYVDLTYVTTFDPYFEKYIKKEFRLMREHIKPADSWHHKLTRLYNDQTVFLDDYIGSNCYLESQQPVKAVLDKIVNEGMEDVADAIIGRQTLNYKYMVIGTSNTAATVNDKSLYGEIGRINMATEGGSAERKGSTVYFNSFFPKTVVTGDIYEIGIVNTSDPASDKMFLRSVLPTADKITHINGADAPNVSVAVYQCPA